MNHLHTDIHSHILPNLDDGASTLEEALKLCQSMAELGYQKLITTPHIHSELYPNTLEQVQQTFEQLTHHPHFQSLNLELHYAAEYYCNENFYNQVLSNENLISYSNGSQKFILIECSTTFLPPFFMQIVKSLQRQHYVVILAHPERYRYVWKEPERCILWRNLGIWLQVDLLSFHPAYSKKAREVAYWLLQNSQVDLVGSDLHNTSQISYLKDLFENEQWLKLLQQCQSLKNTDL